MKYFIIIIQLYWFELSVFVLDRVVSTWGARAGHNSVYLQSIFQPNLWFMEAVRNPNSIFDIELYNKKEKYRGGRTRQMETNIIGEIFHFTFLFPLSIIFPRSKQCNGMENVYSLISLNSNIFWWSAAVPSNISGLAGLAVISRLLLINIVKINSPNTSAKYHPGLFKYSYGLFKQQTDGLQAYNIFRSDSTQYNVKLLNEYEFNLNW